MHTDLRYFIFKAPWTNRDEMRLVSFFVYNSTIWNLRSFFSFFFFIKRICAHKCIKEKLMCNWSFLIKNHSLLVQEPNCWIRVTENFCRFFTIPSTHCYLTRLHVHKPCLVNFIFATTCRTWMYRHLLVLINLHCKV